MSDSSSRYDAQMNDLQVNGESSETDLPVLSELDRQLILLTQKGLPVAPRPYHVLAAALGVTPDEVMDSFRKMLASGKIRRIAAVPNHYKLGFRTNGMTVWDVPDDKVQELGRAMGALPFVSHCYHRPRHLPLWSYNLFAMVHGKSKKEVAVYIEKIAALLGEHCRASDVLYSTKILKKTGLRISADKATDSDSTESNAIEARSEKTLNP